jgi:hypothetical protein
VGPDARVEDPPGLKAVAGDAANRIARRYGQPPATAVEPAR